MKRSITLLLMITAISGCGILPYENNYSCRLKDNFGKCMSIQESYDGKYDSNDERQLVPGKRVNMNNSKWKKRKKSVSNKNARANKETIASEMTSEQMYIDSLYKEMTHLIREPETPIIKAPKEMRTLILSYVGDGNKNTLYMPRYVYTIVDQAQFVIRQYFKTPERDALMVSPKGVK